MFMKLLFSQNHKVSCPRKKLIRGYLVTDIIHQLQDKYYDMLIGVKSTALKFGDDTKKWLTGFAGGMAGLLTMAGHLSDQTWPYYLGVAATAAHIGYQVQQYPHYRDHLPVPYHIEMLLSFFL